MRNRTFVFMRSHAEAFSGALWMMLLTFSAFPCLRAEATESGAEQRISRLQKALLPPVIIDGQVTQGQRLASRMRALHVPGISIAVIRGGKLDWARGFGFAGSGRAAITPQTLFQACSI